MASDCHHDFMYAHIEEYDMQRGKDEYDWYTQEPLTQPMKMVAYTPSKYEYPNV